MESNRAFLSWSDAKCFGLEDMSASPNDSCTGGLTGSDALRQCVREGCYVVRMHDGLDHASQRGHSRLVRVRQVHAEVFGDIDKGAGIELPLDQLPAPGGTGPRTAAGVTVAEASEPVDAVPAPAGAVEVLRELVRRWRSLRAPRPSGT